MPKKHSTFSGKRQPTLYEQRQEFARVVKSLKKKIEVIEEQHPFPGFEAQHRERLTELRRNLRYCESKLENVSGKLTRLS